MELKSVQEVIGNYSGQSRATLEYSQIVKRQVELAKQPGFSADNWSELAELVDVEKFIRVGNFKEVMNWNEYVGFLTNWAPSSDWDCSFKRIIESGNVVFLELEERLTAGDYHSVVNSASVYEFNEQGKIQRIDVYLQMEMPGEDMLKNYEDVL